MKRIQSNGGGANSMAMWRLSVELDQLPDLVVFADVGAPDGRSGEWPDTYAYLRDVMVPDVEKHGVEHVWLTTDDYPIRGAESLLAYFEKLKAMPARISRMCTVAAKIDRIKAFLADRFEGKEDLEVQIGFDANERVRAARDPHTLKASSDRRTNVFPLIEHDLCRCRCAELIRRHGFPVPPKSACFFCPFGSRRDFQALREQYPELFLRTQHLEENSKLTKKGKKIRFGYKHGDDRDPTLEEWIAKPFRSRRISCDVCGAVKMARKAVGCDVQDEDLGGHQGSLF